jgi:uncharacterized membrane protein YkoI
VSAMLRTLLICAVAAIATSMPATASAEDSWTDNFSIGNPQDRWTAEDARTGVEQGEIVPALRVISQVRRQYPGADVLDAELERGNPPRYIIKIRTQDGRRIDVVADARTGRILYER